MWQVLSAATIVAKHTSALCNTCRLASSKTTNPAAKRHFVQSAKEVANSTANLVKTIKVGIFCQACQKVGSVPWLAYRYVEMDLALTLICFVTDVW